MKAKYKNAILAVLAVCLVGCASMREFYDGLSKVSPLLRTSSAVITNVVLEQAVSDEDRQEKAKIVLDIAVALENLTATGDISVEAWAAALENAIPDKDHWHEFAAALILLYADVYADTKPLGDTEQKKVLITAISRIASGVKVAAQTSLK